MIRKLQRHFKESVRLRNQALAQKEVILKINKQPKFLSAYFEQTRILTPEIRKTQPNVSQRFYLNGHQCNFVI